eukprot:805359_1
MFYHYYIKSCDHGCSKCGSGHYDKGLCNHGCCKSGSDCDGSTHLIQSIIPNVNEWMNTLHREIAPAATLYTPKQTLYISLNPTDEPCNDLFNETRFIHLIYCTEGDRICYLRLVGSDNERLTGFIIRFIFRLIFRTKHYLLVLNYVMVGSCITIQLVPHVYDTNTKELPTETMTNN